VVSVPRVVVAVGTDHHPFERLMRWVSGWPEGGIEWFVQHGSSPCPPGARGRPLLGADELVAEMVAADAVVCHGGPGLLMDARMAGHRPVVVARRPDLGEHVDEHQVAFVTWLAARSDIRVAGDERAFEQQVRAAIADGRGDDGNAPNPVVAQRFGSLVEALVRRR
jgi:UDP-N-acetylglucosamine transferase subunit ALG13